MGGNGSFGFFIDENGLLLMDRKLILTLNIVLVFKQELSRELLKRYLARALKKIYRGELFKPKRVSRGMIKRTRSTFRRST